MHVISSIVYLQLLLMIEFHWRYGLDALFFGSTTYYLAKESNLYPRAKKAIILGFSSRIKGYCLWCPSLKNIVSSRDVIFDEYSMLKKLENQTKENGIPQQVEHSQQQVEFEITTLHPTRFVEKNDGNPVIKEDLRDGGEGSVQESQQQLEYIAVNKPRCEIRKPTRYNDTMAYALPIVDDDVPSTHK